MFGGLHPEKHLQKTRNISDLWKPSGMLKFHDESFSPVVFLLPHFAIWTASQGWMFLVLGAEPLHGSYTRIVGEPAD